jgi:hypothetical protein
LREVPAIAAWLAENPEDAGFVDAQDRMRRELVELLEAGEVPARAVMAVGLWPPDVEAELAKVKRKLRNAEDLAEQHRQTIADMDGTIRQLRRERDSRDPEDLDPDLFAAVMDRARRSMVAQVQQHGPEALWPNGVGGGRRRWRR